MRKEDGIKYSYVHCQTPYVVLCRRLACYLHNKPVETVRICLLTVKCAGQFVAVRRKVGAWAWPSRPVTQVKSQVTD